MKLIHRSPAAIGAVVALLAATWSFNACSGSDDAGSPTTPDSGPSETSAPNDATAADAADAAAFVTAPHRPFPTMTAGTNQLLKPLTLVTIVAQNDDQTSALFSFSDALIASNWWKSVGGEYGLGAAAASTHVNGPAITANLDRAGVISYISDAIATSGAPAPNGDTLYLVYIPSGFTGPDAEAGYHAVYPNADAGFADGDAFAFVARQTPASDESQIDQLTRTASRQIVGAALDPKLASWRLPAEGMTPWTGSVWSALASGAVEAGSLCDGTRIREPLGSGAEYQRVWSAAAAALPASDPCVPGLDVPYTNVSVEKDWYPANAGETVTIPLTGWSTESTDPWLLNVAYVQATTALQTLAIGQGLSLETSLGLGSLGTCDPRQAMNNGATGTLTVQMPATAVSGDFVVLTIRSFREALSCDTPNADDIHHVWPVGLYVP